MQEHLKLKVRAFEETTGDFVTEENSGLTSVQIISRYSEIDFFIGMLDAEGNEIFSGDILEDEFEGVHDVVVWCPEWQYRTKNNLDHCQEDFSALYLRGNIRQNPNLME